MAKHLIENEIKTLKCIGGSPVVVSASVDYLEVGDLVINDGNLYVFEGETRAGHLLFKYVEVKK